MQWFGEVSWGSLGARFPFCSSAQVHDQLIPICTGCPSHFWHFYVRNYSNKTTKAARNLLTLSHKCLGLSFLCCEMREQTQGWKASNLKLDIKYQLIHCQTLCQTQEAEIETGVKRGWSTDTTWQEHSGFSTTNKTLQWLQAPDFLAVNH